MSITIWKTPLSLVTVQEVLVPIGSKFLSAHEQHGELVVWYLCDTEAEMETRELIIIGTGIDGPDDIHQYSYIGTGILQNGRTVLHVFEKKMERQ